MNHASTARQTKLRYRWSHRHPVHRAVVRAANRILPWLPTRPKYAIIDALRARSLPYRLVGPGAAAIQVGAPHDTLRSGRSRAMSFARRTAPSGRLVVVEPDRTSAETFERAARQMGHAHGDGGVCGSLVGGHNADHAGGQWSSRDEFHRRLCGLCRGHFLHHRNVGNREITGSDRR